MPHLQFVTNIIMDKKMITSEGILLNYSKYIAVTERRAVSYRDCARFYFEDQEYTIGYGIFRNKISELRKKKKVEKVFHSNLAFYKPVGYEISGNKMTDNGAWVSTNSPL